MSAKQDGKIEMGRFLPEPKGSSGNRMERGMLRPLSEFEAERLAAILWEGMKRGWRIRPHARTRKGLDNHERHERHENR